MAGRSLGISRRRRWTPRALAVLALASAGGADAQDMPDMPKVAPSPIACPATPAALPAELAGWNPRTALSAGADARSAARLEPGRAVDGGLRATPQVRFALRPEKPGGSVSFGGIYAFSVKAAGKYRVALGSAAWIDVVKDGAAVTSIAHGHGPDCSGIRKMVDFTLEPGEYLLQISANPEAKLPLLVTRLP
ncbi:hypothetical protein WBP07_23760 [Novosphingobium sp. BL-8A]|uniref:hypothetical protein n=1 Tax=Novosphingobium sp. BL-8A TaxID=3127639 RepID=UPI00375848A7